ncbi:MAG: protein-tyrosine phosphatase family protein [Candidatus Promineifilaceae bacterium]|nr:protein-tyrosine phosphatase family protein [Candidatus Promineifilaceae bacterium]
MGGPQGSAGGGTPALPHDNAYWVIPGRFMAGEYPGARGEAAAREKIGRHLDAGVTFFLDLTHPYELEPYEALLQEEAAARELDVQYRRLPIADVSVPERREEMVAILDAIHEALSAGHVVYVHCWGGVGRTGTVVGCHLVRGGMSGDDALAQIARWWQTVGKRQRQPRSPETHEQEDYVRGWRES